MEQVFGFREAVLDAAPTAERSNAFGRDEQDYGQAPMGSQDLASSDADRYR
jgi:hypothetical protein